MGRGRIRVGGAAVLLALGTSIAGAAPGADAAVGGGGESTSTVTTSTTRHTTITRFDRPPAFADRTRVVATVDGEALFDETADGGPTSSAVLELLERAAAVVEEHGRAPSAPVVSATETTSTEVLLSETVDHTDTSVTTTTTFGPATILIGVDQSQTFFVAAGTINVNTNTHTETFVDATYQRTDTTTTTVFVDGAAVVATTALRFTG